MFTTREQLVSTNCLPPMNIFLFTTHEHNRFVHYAQKSFFVLCSEHIYKYKNRYYNIGVNEVRYRPQIQSFFEIYP